MGVHRSPFASTFVAATDRALTVVEFRAGDGPAGPLARLREDWPEATVEPGGEGGPTSGLVRLIFGAHYKVHLSG